MPCRHFATYTLSQLTLREGNMIAKVERVEGRYLVDLTDYANKVHIRKQMTEDEARDLASDLEGCARAIFAMLPDIE